MHEHRGVIRIVVAAFLALLIAAASQAQENEPATGTAAEARAAAEQEEAEQRTAAAQRLIRVLRRQGSEASAELAERTDGLLLKLVAGETPTSAFNREVQKLEDEVWQKRQATHADAMGGAGNDGDSSFGSGLAISLAVAALALSLFLYLRRRDVIEQTLKDAGLL